jgi:hypothetical protein
MKVIVAVQTANKKPLCQHKVDMSGSSQEEALIRKPWLPQEVFQVLMIYFPEHRQYLILEYINNHAE